MDPNVYSTLRISSLSKVSVNQMLWKKVVELLCFCSVLLLLSRQYRHTKQRLNTKTYTQEIYFSQHNS